MRGFGIVVVAVALAGCGQKGELAAQDAWVRLSAVPGRPAAAYVTVKGGAAADTLLSVTTPAAIRTELHESMKHDGGMMAMAAIRDVPVPAGGTVAFAPGGKHVMLFDVNPAVMPGATTKLVLAFAGGKSVTVDAKVVAAGDDAPK